ncbi:hypothetical protein FRC03_012579 [Tulasnella sp. 419]|nr:hypothetical protein FRC03_012579 [Tulasnella sp. 419]
MDNNKTSGSVVYAPPRSGNTPNRRQRPPQAHGPRGRRGYFITAPEPLKPRAPRPLPKSTPKSSQSSSASSSFIADSTPTTDDYDNYTLLSVDPSDWKYSVMTFKPPNASTTVDFAKDFNPPIKMNRKQPKSVIYSTPATSEQGPLKPMLGADGKPVYGPDGKIIMVNSEGQTTISMAKAAAAAKDKGKGKDKEAPGAKKKGSNKPRTKQTFVASEETRAKRREEYNPWVLEDANGNQEWVGRMEDRNDDGIYVMLRVEGTTFSVLPVHRYYKFLDKRQYVARMNADVANDAWTKKKTPNVAREFARRNNGNVTRATQAFLEKVKIDEMKMDQKPKIKSEDDLFGGDDDEDRKPDLGAEGDFDEMEWEEEVADDEEGMQHDGMAEDEEEKNTQERLKREYKAANQLKDSFVDDDEDEEFEDLLNEDGKRMKDVLKKMGNKEYEDESDDEDSDYYSKRYGDEKKEEPQPEQPMLSGVRVQAAPTATPKAPVKAKTPVPSGTPGATTVAPLQPSSNTLARTDGTPHPPRAGSPSSGAALVAMRATSPKVRGPSRASSPQAGHQRATSPLAPGSVNRAGSPANGLTPANAATSNAKKRKAGEGSPTPPSTQLAATSISTTSGSIPGTPSGDAQPMKKKKKTDTSNPQGAPSPSAGEGSSATPATPAGHRPPFPTIQSVIAFIEEKGGKVTANEIAIKFRTKDSAERKATLISLIKQLCTMVKEEGTQKVVLKPEYGSSPLP